MTDSVVSNLERAAALWPHRCAIRSGDDETPFATLWDRSRSMAGFLQANGLVPGDRVAILAAPSADWVAACYGIFLAGGIAVTLNAAARARDFETWLRHSGSRWLVCDSLTPDITAALQQLDVPVRVLARTKPTTDAEWLGDALLSAQPFSPKVMLDGAMPASILYTSGTTGNPKGVLLSHGNLASNCSAIREYLQLTQEDSIVNVLPFYYSYGASVLHTHLAAGARIVLEQNFVYPHLIADALARERATGFAGVPSTYALLLSRVDLSTHDLFALRYVTQAGGAMPVPLVRKLKNALPATRIFVMYGQTEATARLTWLPPEQLEAKAGSAGIPIRDVQIEIRRESGEIATAGEIGEVRVRGPNVMLGYWNDPEATAQTVKEGWLRTGDMGHLDEDGFLFLAGRRSDMIKTGAHRVHPGDIEEVISELDAVAEVAVIGMPDEILGQAIHAFIVTTPGRELDVARVKAHCRDRLAAYKIPRRVDFVPALPKTASGKIRRRELVTEEAL